MFGRSKNKYPDVLPRRTHRKSIQILVIPDDQAEPKSYRLSNRKAAFLKILFLLFVVHAVTGVLGYIYLMKYINRTVELLSVNDQLAENSKKVRELAVLFQKIQASDSKIRSALGLGSEGESRSIEFTPPKPEQFPAVISSEAERIKPTQVDLREKLGFFQQSTNIGIHEYLRSMPTFLPVAGVLTTRYQESTGAADALPHRGIDIAAPRGSFVHAAGDGIVVFAGWTQDLGNMIILFHGNGFFTYYGHNQRLLVNRNSLVRKGDTIALLGSSGASSAPHLHFEMWKDGVPLNPADYILAFSGM